MVESNKILDIITLFSDSFEKSKTEIKNLIKSNGLYLNDKKVTSNRQIEFPNDFIHKEHLIMRIGKKDYRIFTVKNGAQIEGNWYFVND